MNQQVESFSDRINLNTLKYLTRLSDLSNSSCQTLQSYHLYNRAVHDKKNKVKPTDVITKTPTRCAHCYMKFIDSNSQYFVKPGIKRTSFHKKLQSKYESGKPLTKYQTQYMKKMGTFLSNKMEIVCGFCKHKTQVILDKPKNLPSLRKGPSEECKPVISATPKKPKFIKNIDTLLTPNSIPNNKINNISENTKKKKKKKRKSCVSDEPAHSSSQLSTSVMAPRQSSAQSTPISNNNSSKKKRRRKDKFCGLQKDAVLSANTSNNTLESNGLEKCESSSAMKKKIIATENEKNSMPIFKSHMKEHINNLVNSKNKKSGSKETSQLLVRNMGTSKIKKAKNKKAMKSKLNSMLNLIPDTNSNTSFQQFLKNS